MHSIRNRISITKNTLFKILLSAGLLSFILYKAQIGAIGQIISGANLKYYIFSIALYVAAQPIRTLRWGILLQKKDVAVSQSKLLFLCFIGTFFSSFLPTIVGGDMVRGYYVFRETNSHEVSFASIIVERLCGLLVVVVTGFAASIYFLIMQGLTPIITISFAGCFITFLLLLLVFNQTLVVRILRPLKFMQRWGIIQTLKEIYQATISYRSHLITLIWCLALSVLYELIIIYIHYLLSLALAWSIPFNVFVLAVPVITLVSMFPFSFGGLGVREGATVVFFSQYAISAANAVSMSLMSYSIALAAGAIGGVIYAFYTMERKQNNRPIG
jgi:uncharacterized protein (TIRG00374 family)